MSKSAWTWIVIVVVVVIAGFIYLNSGSSGPAYPVAQPTQEASSLESVPAVATEQPTEQPSTTAPATSGVVTISNFTFSPAVLTVKAGTTVTWTNQDSVQHDVKGDTFQSTRLSTGDTYQFTFTTPGAFDYICSIHPMIKGTIVVQ